MMYNKRTTYTLSQVTRFNESESIHITFEKVIDVEILAISFTLFLERLVLCLRSCNIIGSLMKWIRTDNGIGRETKKIYNLSTTKCFGKKNYSIAFRITIQIVAHIESSWWKPHLSEMLIAIGSQPNRKLLKTKMQNIKLFNFIRHSAHGTVAQASHWILFEFISLDFDCLKTWNFQTNVCMFCETTYIKRIGFINSCFVGFTILTSTFLKYISCHVGYGFSDIQTLICWL